MSEELKTASTAANPQIAVLGMSCAIVSALVLLYAGDYIFLRTASFIDVLKSVNAYISLPVQLIHDYGWALWVTVAGFTVVSLHQAVRRGGRPRTVVINVGTLAATITLTWLARNAVWEPFLSMFQGVGVQR